MKKTIILLISNILLIACNSLQKKYEISYNEHEIFVTIPMPNIGIARIGAITYDGFTLDDIEKEIFDKLRKNEYKGIYNVKLAIKFKDKYGNYTEQEEYVLSNLDANEMKKYASFSYFEGTLEKEINKIIHDRPTVHINTTLDNINKIVIKDNEDKECSQMNNNDYIIQQIRETTFHHYYNERFNYSITYPSIFTPNEESNNGDGRKFTMNDDIYLSVSAIYNILDESIESQYEQYDIKSITYSQINDNWFVVSDYTPDGRIFYRKTIQYNDIFATATLYYPVKYKNEFKPIIKKIFTNFHN